MPSFKIIGPLVLEKKIFKGFCYVWSCNLGHIDINFYSPFLRMLHMNLALNGKTVSEEKIFEYYGNIHVYCPGVGVNLSLGSNFFTIINLQSVCPFP